MKNFLKRGLASLAFVLGMSLGCPQMANATGLPDLPNPSTELGFKLKNYKLDVINLEGTDIYLLVCRDGDTGAVIWARMLGGDSL